MSLIRAERSIGEFISLDQEAKEKIRRQITFYCAIVFPDYEILIRYFLLQKQPGDRSYKNRMQFLGIILGLGVSFSGFLINGFEFSLRSFFMTEWVKVEI